MFIDASALTALMTDEDDARELLARMQLTRRRLTSPLAVWEAAIAVARVLDLAVSEAAEAVERYLALMEIDMVAVPPDTARLALDAFDRYGKGRHPARLNFGDCFAYACARHFGQPLMFKGADFPQTDIEAA
ncbi:MAG: type II toxin-antitoxin system VapC family toxin [Mesorhizobium sp.]|uniref:type II toxin-antitoxin system VapC family toxin n=1 Tax=Mesorhizobium sp. TaxID=1871066 RepID=UPI0012298BA0|nr:type II toxin-antitoxin system VapC family toxin [Mesorhizobium sp.]TIS53524.1 MAG: type II toxin-antitoxin system VapC family toxin [Mesorhizobium sp.]TIS86227.1 MAG: type II toxin-antitoxin system VapC family toxin [Mesorhizobium sp.]TJW06986.1 MAG: type II toxin-antitoxin system VapC family toxin [Mesorhizobium sp.]